MPLAAASADSSDSAVKPTGIGLGFKTHVTNPNLLNFQTTPVQVPLHRRVMHATKNPCTLIDYCRGNALEPYHSDVWGDWSRAYT